MSKKGKDILIKKFDRLTIWLFVMAFLFLTYGLYHYFYLGSTVVSHSKDPQPSLSNGIPTIFFGSIFILLALFRTLNRSKLIKQLDDLNKLNS